MRTIQWFVFAVIFLLTALYFQYTAIIRSAESREVLIEAKKAMETAGEEGNIEWADTIYLSQKSYAETIITISMFNFSFARLCWSLFIAFTICGFIELRAGKKKK